VGAAEYELFGSGQRGGGRPAVALPATRAVGGAFLWRRWLYLLWDEVAQLVRTFNRANFDLATKSLLPWLA
jgi:hypothetical protein